MHQSNITVIGLGAVGSHMVEAIVRCGIGTIRIVDFDEISDSNFNRQLYAVEPNLGRLKTEAAKVRILQIDPRIKVELFNTLCYADIFDEVFQKIPN